MTPTPEIRLRHAEMRDREAVFALANNPVVRANSIHTEPISWETHVAWFAKAISNPSLFFLVAETTKGEFVGEVRLALENEGWVITIHLLPAFRGKGLGAIIMRQAITQSQQNRFVAYVKPHNAASACMFRSIGFESTGLTKIRNGNISVELLRFQLNGELS